MTQYRRGRQKEYEFMKMMRDDGYVTLRTAGSHGDWDILFYKDQGTMHMAQLKYTEDGKFTKNEFKRFEEAPLPEGAAGYFITYKKGHSGPFRIYVRTCREASRIVIRDGDDSTWIYS
jgi:hypothetical protein